MDKMEVKCCGEANIAMTTRDKMMQMHEIANDQGCRIKSIKDFLYGNIGEPIEEVHKEVTCMNDELDVILETMKINSEILSVIQKYMM